MLCALLRVVKIFFVGNAFFSSNAIVHLDRNFTLAAITYHLEHDALHIDHTVTLVQDSRYHVCFKDHPHTVTNHYLFLGPELKEKLLHMDRVPLLGVSRLEPCLYVNPSGPRKGVDRQNSQNSQTTHTNDPTYEGGLHPTVSKTVQPSKGQHLVDGFSRDPLPSIRPTPSSKSSPGIRPIPRSIIQERNNTNTSAISPTPLHFVTNTTVPNWVQPASGRTIQSNRPNRNSTSGSEKWSHTGSVHNQSAHNQSAHDESITPTELIMEPSRIWKQRKSNNDHRLDDGDATLSDFDRVLSVMDSEESEESDESEEPEESED